MREESKVGNEHDYVQMLRRVLTCFDSLMELWLTESNEGEGAIKVPHILIFLLTDLLTLLALSGNCLSVIFIAAAAVLEWGGGHCSLLSSLTLCLRG